MQMNVNHTLFKKIKRDETVILYTKAHTLGYDSLLSMPATIQIEGNKELAIFHFFNYYDEHGVLNNLRHNHIIYEHGVLNNLRHNHIIYLHRTLNVEVWIYSNHVDDVVPNHTIK